MGGHISPPVIMQEIEYQTIKEYGLITVWSEIQRYGGLCSRME